MLSFLVYMSKIYFIPRYIASLKYYEKLFQGLREKGCEPQFLLFEDKGMAAYSRRRGLPCDTRFLVLQRGVHIPLYSPVARERRMIREFEKFLAERPHTLVTETTIPPLARLLFAHARARGIRTLALQWCQESDKTRHLRLTFSKQLQKLRGRYGSVASGLVHETYFALSKTLFWFLDLFVRQKRLTEQADAIGVIDSYAKNLFIKRGWRQEQIEIVGHADFTLMRQRKTPKRHGRTRILILSTPFYIGHASVFTDRKGQSSYFGEIFKTIREVFSVDEADILFKLHPREENIYADLENQDITILGNEANIEELVASADLYIAHPLTAANFTAIARRVPALFINFTPLLFLDDGKELYHLRSITKTHEEFHKKLQDFKQGILPFQYDQDAVDPTSLQKIISFITGV